MRRLAATRWCGALALVLAVQTAPASAGEAAPESRVLVISVPGLRWEDVERPEVPRLRALLDDSSVANLATRVTRTITEPGEAYLTLGAGNRAVAPRGLAAQAYDAAEPFGAGTAGEEHGRQQGVTVVEDAVVVVSWPLLQSANAAAEYDATLGALGQTLADASIDRGVVGNADADDPFDLLPAEHREAASALADERGQVECGTVGGRILRSDDTAPFGVRLDVTEVVAATAACTTERSVVLVEASDLRRAGAASPRASDVMADVAWSEALRDTDALVGSLLDEVVRPGDSVVIVAPTTSPERGLGVLGVRADGWERGLLTSANTRRAGYVLLADVAPTIASLAGVEMDEAGLEGRSAEVRADGRSPAARRAHLVDEEAAANFRDDQITSVVWVFAGATSLLGLLAALSIALRWRGLEPWLGRIGLVLVALPTWTYLAGLGSFHERGAVAYWAFLLLGSLATGVVAGLGRGSVVRPLLIVYGALLAVVTVSVVLLDSRLQLSTVFGDSPIVAGRFSGINNVTFALYLGAAIVVATLITEQVPAPRGPKLAVGLLAAVLLVDVAPMWGADVGGALAGVPSLALVAIGLGRWRVRWRTVALLAVATLAFVVVLGLLDLSRASADRSHLGRLFERIGSDGSRGLTTVVERKLTVNLRSLTTSDWRFVVAPFALGVGVMAWRGRERIRTVSAAMPSIARAAPGFLVLALFGYAANDSGIAVPAALVCVVVPGLVHIASHLREPEGSA